MGFRGHLFVGNRLGTKESVIEFLQILLNPVDF